MSLQKNNVWVFSATINIISFKLFFTPFIFVTCFRCCLSTIFEVYGGTFDALTDQTLDVCTCSDDQSPFFKLPQSCKTMASPMYYVTMLQDWIWVHLVPAHLTPLEPPPTPHSHTPTCPLNITAGMGRFAAWRVYLLPVQQLSNESLRWWIFKSLYGRRWTLQKKDWIKVRSLVQQGTSIHILIYYIQCQWIQTL